MEGAVYKVIELAGTSKSSVDDAVQNAIVRASQTIRGIRWFAVTETRGTVENGRIDSWQVSLKVGFHVD
jgi:dodecin